jgi:hypothetical protein
VPIVVMTNAQVAGLIGPSDLVGGADCKRTNDAGPQKIADAFATVLTGGPATPGASPVAMVGEYARR